VILVNLGSKNMPCLAGLPTDNLRLANPTEISSFQTPLRYKTGRLCWASSLRKGVPFSAKVNLNGSLVEKNRIEEHLADQKIFGEQTRTSMQ